MQHSTTTKLTTLKIDQLTCRVARNGKFANYASEIVTIAWQAADNTFEAVDAFSATVSWYTGSQHVMAIYLTMSDWSVPAEHFLSELRIPQP
jgi:hypothetical protein